jgi:hypothetical protein
VVRHEGEFTLPAPTTDDLEALANAVREAARPAARPTQPEAERRAVEVGRRGHLRVLRDGDRP